MTSNTTTTREVVFRRRTQQPLTIETPEQRGAKTKAALLPHKVKPPSDSSASGKRASTNRAASTSNNTKRWKGNKQQKRKRGKRGQGARHGQATTTTGNVMSSKRNANSTLAPDRYQQLTQEGPNGLVTPDQHSRAPPQARRNLQCGTHHAAAPKSSTPYPAPTLRQHQRQAQFSKLQQRDGGGGDGVSDTQKKYASTPCKFFLHGGCRKDNCQFSHAVEQIRKDHEVCKFFLAGKCKKGDTCLFSHNLKLLPCRYFFTVGCTMKNCRFSHDALSDAQTSVLQNDLEEYVTMKGYKEASTTPAQGQPYNEATLPGNSANHPQGQLNPEPRAQKADDTSTTSASSSNPYRTIANPLLQLFQPQQAHALREDTPRVPTSTTPAYAISLFDVDDGDAEPAEAPRQDSVANSREGDLSAPTLSHPLLAPTEPSALASTAEKPTATPHVDFAALLQGTFVDAKDAPPRSKAEDCTNTVSPSSTAIANSNNNNSSSSNSNSNSNRAAVIKRASKRADAKSYGHKYHHFKQQTDEGRKLAEKERLDADVAAALGRDISVAHPACNDSRSAQEKLQQLQQLMMAGKARKQQQQQQQQQQRTTIDSPHERGTDTPRAQQSHQAAKSFYTAMDPSLNPFAA